MIPGIQSYLASQRASIFALLKAMVLTQSGTRNKAGVDAVGNLIQRACRSLPVTIETIEQPDLGNHLIVRSTAGDTDAGRILLVGHMDTVFPADTDFNWYREDERHSYGPGVCDMKGGLVAGIFALKALAAAGLLEQTPITFVFNSDEEIGSPSSRDLIAAQARASAAAFVLECGGPEGEVVTGRKGSLVMEIAVQGRAGHAAFAGSEKASAILELAHKTVALEKLNDIAGGVTVNVGTITGGIGANTVAETAHAHVDCRFIRPDQEQTLIRQIDLIAQARSVPGTQCRRKIVSSRPPMPRDEKNLQLYAIVERTASALGQSIPDEYRQGVSDANKIAAQGTPVVDGLGPVGGRDHSAEEYMLTDSLVPRTRLLTHAIVAAHRHYA